MTHKPLTAALLSVMLMLPASSALAARHKYSRTRGTLIGAAVGALVAHDHLKGAVIGGAVGNGVQYARDQNRQRTIKHNRNFHAKHRRYYHHYR
jgi:hypothetical protein